MVQFSVGFLEGLNLINDGDSLTPNESTVCHNFELTTVGTLSKVKGVVTRSWPSNERILFCGEYDYSAGSYKLLLTDKNVYSTSDFINYNPLLSVTDDATPVSSTAMGSGMGSTSYALKGYSKKFSGVAYRDYFILCNGEAVLTLYNQAGNWYLAENSTAWSDSEILDNNPFNLPTGSSFGFWNTNYSFIQGAIPRLVTVWNNKLVFSYSETSPYRVWITGVNNFKLKPQYNPGSGDVINNPGYSFDVTKTGDVVSGLITYLEELIIFKTNSIYKLSGYSDEQFLLSEVKLNNGAYNPGAIAAYGDDILFVNEKGLQALSRTDILGTLGTAEISKKVAPIFREIAKNNKGSFVRLIVYKPGDQLWMLYTDKQTYSDKVLLFHPQLTAFTSRDILPSTYNTSEATDIIPLRDGRLLAVHPLRLWECNVGYGSDAGPTQCRYESGWLGDTGNKKRVLSTTVRLSDVGAGSFTYTQSIDWNDYGRSKSFTKRVIPGQFILNVSLLDGNFALLETGSSYTQRQLAGSGNFKVLKLSLEESSNTAFEVKGLDLDIQGGSLVPQADN